MGPVLVIRDDGNVAFDLEAYLQRIGHAGPVEPRVECLDAMHLSHVRSIPFENLDILLGRPIRLDLDSVQDKLVRRRRGGYCFEHNTLFAAALEAVGFEVRPLGARVHLWTRAVTARTHMTLRVDVDGSGRLADVGFGGGSLLQSLPIEPGPPVDQFGWRFRLVEMEEGLMLQTARPEGWRDLYAFTFERQHPVDFEVANHYTSTHPSSHFTTTPTVQVSSPERSLILRGTTLTEVTPEGETASEIDPGELVGVLETRFGLDVPEAAGLRSASRP